MVAAIRAEQVSSCDIIYLDFTVLAFSFLSLLFSLWPPRSFLWWGFKDNTYLQISNVPLNHHGYQLSQII